MENQETKNEALIGGSGLNAGLCDRNNKERIVMSERSNAGGQNGGLYPPSNCCCRNCGFRNFGANPGFYRGGGIKEPRFTSEMGADIRDLICSMRALVEDVRVALGIEIKAGDVLGKSVVVDIPGGEAPKHGVNFDLAMRNNKPLGTGQEHDDSHGLNVADAMRRDGNRDGA